MKFFGIAILVCLAPAWAQTPLPNISDETVVATFDDGVKMTMGEFKRIYAVLPPETQKQAMQNRQGFLEQWALMRKLTKLAESEKLDQLSPAKESLEYYRLAILSQARMDQAALDTVVLPSQVQDYYEGHKDRYRQVRVKAIYVSFAGRKIGEADAKAKASRLAAQARAGADFVKLVRENSDDEASRAKDGEFLTLRATDNIPDAVRDTIFRLHQGEVSEPVAQSNGYYIFRVEEISFRPYPDVRDEIFSELKQKNYADWVDKIRRSTNVQYNNMEFVGAVPMNTTPKK
jgi:peptidyl-prolyl cis-trans isomerase C